MTIKIQCKIRGTTRFCPALITTKPDFPITLPNGRRIPYSIVESFLVRSSPRTKAHLLAWLKRMPVRRFCVVVV